jgi:hypothetical protein
MLIEENLVEHRPKKKDLRRALTPDSTASARIASFVFKIGWFKLIVIYITAYSNDSE